MIMSSLVRFLVQSRLCAHNINADFASSKQTHCTAADALAQEYAAIACFHVVIAQYGVLGPLVYMLI